MWPNALNTLRIERWLAFAAAAVCLSSQAATGEAQRDPQGRITYRGEASQEEALRAIAAAAGLTVEIAGRLDPTPRAWWLSTMRFDAALAAVLDTCNWAMVNSPGRASFPRVSPSI